MRGPARNGGVDRKIALAGINSGRNTLIYAERNEPFFRKHDAVLPVAAAFTDKPSVINPGL